MWWALYPEAVVALLPVVVLDESLGFAILVVSVIGLLDEHELYLFIERVCHLVNDGVRYRETTLGAECDGCQCRRRVGLLHRSGFTDGDGSGVSVDDLYRLAVLYFGDESQRCAQCFGADIVAVRVDGVVPFAALQLDNDAVGDVEALLADVLYAVDQLAGYAFVNQLLGQRDVECHGERAVVGDDPAGNVLSGDFDVGEQHFAVGSLYADHAASVGFEGVDLFLTEGKNGGAEGFHDLAVTRAEGLEVGLDFLDQEIVVGCEEFDCFDVEFGADEVLHTLKLSLHLGVAHRNDDTLQRLPHTQVALLAQAEHHGADLLGQLHALLEGLVYHGCIHLGEGQVVHTLHIVAMSDGVEVAR